MSCPSVPSATNIDNPFIPKDKRCNKEERCACDMGRKKEQAGASVRERDKSDREQEKGGDLEKEKKSHRDKDKCDREKEKRGDREKEKTCGHEKERRSNRDNGRKEKSDREKDRKAEKICRRSCSYSSSDSPPHKCCRSKEFETSLPHKRGCSKESGAIRVDDSPLHRSCSRGSKAGNASPESRHSRSCSATAAAAAAAAKTEPAAPRPAETQAPEPKSAADGGTQADQRAAHVHIQFQHPDTIPKARPKKDSAVSARPVAGDNKYVTLKARAEDSTQQGGGTPARHNAGDNGGATNSRYLMPVAIRDPPPRPPPPVMPGICRPPWAKLCWSCGKKTYIGKGWCMTPVCEYKQWR